MTTMRKGFAVRAAVVVVCALTNGVAGVTHTIAMVPGFGRALISVSAGFSRTVYAQEGHPLVGTWHGTWGPNATERHDVTLVLEFDGKAITGMMNPGPDSVRFDKVTLDPSNWNVRMEAAPKGTSRGAPIVIDVTIQDITNRYRSLVGTWTQGSVKGDFKATRDS